MHRTRRLQTTIKVTHLHDSRANMHIINFQTNPHTTVLLKSHGDSSEVIPVFWMCKLAHSIEHECRPNRKARVLGA